MDLIQFHSKGSIQTDAHEKNDTSSASSPVTKLPSASSLVIKEILSGKKKNIIKISLEGFPKIHLMLEVKKIFHIPTSGCVIITSIKEYHSKENVTCINESTMIQNMI